MLTFIAGILKGSGETRSTCRKNVTHAHTDLGVTIAETQCKLDGMVKSRFTFHAFFKGAEGLSDWGPQAGWQIWHILVL